jgi:16S rRNA (uracil1498-N3)-methyltransferase
MHRFFVDPTQSADEVIELSDREAHHAATVLRLQPKERVVVLDGRGSELLCHVNEIGKHRVSLRVYQRGQIQPLPYRLTLVQAVPKGKTMETIVQKATELGAWRVAPIISDRTVAHIDDDNADTKMEKWNWIAIDSIKQCGSAWIPQISAPATLADYLANPEKCELNLIASLQPDARHPRTFLSDFVKEKGRRPKSIAVWVGPEGDFTPAEVSAVRGAGALPITLGQLVLRSETAAFYCLSVLNYELQAPE